ncbi:LysR family transcriptional regulator [Rudanella paleaurantiibacter]|uniref:LysR family transcriptional regulator n=1 Tax=Rudanella paleaurantiibacter TaxID=2614655 RepID=A0A7J5TW33_9BACT|nr:hydrogen peroxide-inducible genes activator [Rudanella paleaurantiibacter]KAB7728647.1 LysR family transcriptional regulator [Rudanella paleaurantiibacter]
MTLTQLEYIIAVDTFRHFATAAQHCHVTQPTLSMQIQKLEDELGVQLFDRSRQPVVPTEVGQVILLQAREVVQAARRIPEIVKESSDEISGELRLGIIPTLAPYLLPLFIGSFMHRFAGVSVQIQELTTEHIVEQLRKGLLDVGLAVTPLHEMGLTEKPLFEEPFVGYVADSHPLAGQQELSAADLQAEGLWLLTEGHCFRDQVVNLCGADLRNRSALRYETGSLETLIKLIDRQEGFTLLPYLATLDMEEPRRARLRPLGEPQPVRQVSLLLHRNGLKRRLIDALRREILAHLPPEVAQTTEHRKLVGLR